VTYHRGEIERQEDQRSGHASRRAEDGQDRRVHLLSPFSGPQDFSCAICHGQDGKRIRLQDLGNLTTREGAGMAMKTWPSYRVSQGCGVDHAAPSDRLHAPGALA
jgi:mono/diheme cytochrome c family protein